MAPEKLSVWKDAAGKERLIVVEQAGPNRVSEWSTDGKLLREFMSLQTYANDGYGFDPEHADHVYLSGKRGWMTRFKVNFATGEWKVNAVWPFEENDPLAGRLDRPKVIRTQGRLYIAGRRSFTIYRFDGDQLLLSAGILRLGRDSSKHALWHDANGNGRVDEEELNRTPLPGQVLTYHGQNWLEDLSLLAPAEDSQDVWRLEPSGFDPHGNPIFKTWTKVLTDPSLRHAEIESPTRFTAGTNWIQNFPATGSEPMALQSKGTTCRRGGPSFSANFGSQHKITRYVPDGKGGYQMKWRIGRSVLQGIAQRGEIYGAMRIQRPINGLVSVIDQSRCGVVLYTDEGLYVDTLFPDDIASANRKRGSTSFLASSLPERSCRIETTESSTSPWASTRPCSSRSKAGRCETTRFVRSRTCKKQ